MALLQDTVAAIATAPGRGGIAVIRLSGVDAYRVAGKVFRPLGEGRDVAEAKGYTAMYGDFVDRRGEALDRGIALFFRAPHSYTGEDVIELSCHGGEQVSRAVLRACFDAGALPAGPGEFTKRAVLNGRMDLSQAEAVIDLIDATSGQAAALANRTLEGHFYRQLEPVKQTLLELAGHLAAYIDYPEEDVEALSVERFCATLEACTGPLQRLLDGFEEGMQLRRGINAAIVGSPNVGKSTIFNLLTRFDRSIVTPIAGTTRDIVREHVQIGGLPVFLADTAGLHETQDVVEKEGIRRSYEELEGAGLIIAVFDGSQPVQEEDLRLAVACKGRPALALVNKTDKEQHFEMERIQEYFAALHPVSAQDPAARDQIEQAVGDVLRLDRFDPDALLLANERQRVLVQNAVDSIQQAQAAARGGVTLDAAGVCLQSALVDLSQLTGEDATESIIDDVFSRFCVGK